MKSYECAKLVHRIPIAGHDRNFRELADEQLDKGASSLMRTCG